MRLFKLFIVLFICHNHLSTQSLCSGSLGDNIFLDGDFGTGTATVVSINPNIAPGYSYTTSLPSDGFYSLVKTTSVWGNLYSSWLQINDNSHNKDGYMMVVNASFNPGKFYEKVVDGLCGNTTYQFSADIINLVRSSVSNHIDPDVAFLLDDKIIYTTGIIPKNEQWITYGFTFTTAPGQSSIKLSLRNNAPGGYGNDLALDNISFRACGPTAFLGIVSGQTVYLCTDDEPISIQANVDNNLDNYFLWQLSVDKVNWTDVKLNKESNVVHSNFNPGDYYYRYYSAGDEESINNAKCRVLSDVVHIKVLPLTYNHSDTICEGNFYKFGNQLINRGGEYVETFLSDRGCDSVVYLNLVMKNDPNIIADFTLTDPSCYKYKDGEILISNINGGYGNYQTYFENEKVNNGVIKNLSGGLIKIVIKDKYQCRDSFEVLLNDPEQFALNGLNDFYITLGEELVINANANYPIEKIDWQPKSIFDCSDCLTVIALVPSTQTLKIEAENEFGCKAINSFTVNVTKSNTFALPNVIKEGTSTNSLFQLSSFKKSVSLINTLEIYDRSGNKVHHFKNKAITNNPTELWNGKMNNDFVSSGVYTYYLKLTFLDGSTEDVFGDITVVK